MRTDENKFRQIRNTVEDGCVHVRRDFDKRLYKKIMQIVINISVCNKVVDNGYTSVVLYMRLSRQFNVFFYENILSVKKHQNAKQTTFTLLEVFVCEKIVASVVGCSLIVVLLVDFCLWSVFLHSQSFRKKLKLSWSPQIPYHWINQYCW